MRTRFTVSVLRALIAALFACFALNVAAAADLRAPLGDEAVPATPAGLSVQQVLCPANSVLTGLKQVLGYWLYETYIECQPVDQNGDWVGFASWPKTPLGAQPNSDTGWNDFDVVTIGCPGAGYIAGFSGIEVLAITAGDDARMPGMITPVCHAKGNTAVLDPREPPTDWQRPQNQQIDLKFDAPVQLLWLGDTDESSCPPGEAAIGVWGFSGSWLFTVGLVCQPFSQVVPRQVDVAQVLRTAAAEPVVQAAASRVAMIKPNLPVPPPNGANTGHPPPAPPAPGGAYDRIGIGDATTGFPARWMCPQGSAVSSAVMVVENTMLELNTICAGIAADGRLTGSKVNGNGIPLMRREGWNVGDNSVITYRRESDCPAGDYLVGFAYGVAEPFGPQQQYPWHAFAACWDPASGANPVSPYGVAPSELNATHQLLAWDGALGVSSCRIGDVAVGVYGMASDDLLDAVGLVCEPLSAAKPQPTVAAQKARATYVPPYTPPAAPTYRPPPTAFNPASKPTPQLCKQDPQACGPGR